ncbi:SDR family NAD(P)-dependent oxidoreductase [Cyclobacteriaceae bacterium YHN15]|jgi:uncharacterized protein|nr:SDR family NAD(P)-dependent oxidoreductase [Cyclobacteriaceae bacterium YHN15]
MKQYALITGASQGLGKAFAIEIAKKKINTILVSLPNEDLSVFCEEIKEMYGVDSICFETDLSIVENVIDLTEWVNSQFELFILVNNAGIGGSKKITDAKLSYIENILQLNVVATTVLIHQLLPNLLRQPKAHIFNISSLAAFFPIGFKTVYPASKAFLDSFSQGLNQELRRTRVFVSVVNPGPMRTNGELVERTNKGFVGKLLMKDPEKVAKICIKNLFKRKAVIVVNPVSWFLLKFIPPKIKTAIMTNVAQHELT